MKRILAHLLFFRVAVPSDVAQKETLTVDDYEPRLLWSTTRMHPGRHQYLALGKDGVGSGTAFQGQALPLKNIP